MALCQLLWLALKAAALAAGARRWRVRRQRTAGGGAIWKSSQQ
jgi:hypothetical protein